MEFYIVDAFSNMPFGGNPAGVVICKENLDVSTMQKIAAEVRFSETAFVKQLDQSTFEVKFYTPTAEVDLCGHATISTFQVLLSKNLVKPNNTYKMLAKAGELSIFVYENHIMMEQAKPKKGTNIIDISEFCEALNINITEVGDKNHILMPEIITTGLWDIIFPVKSSDILNKISPNFNKLSQLSSKYNAVGIHVFTLDSPKEIARCRNFAPLYGIDEEAATGTANGALTYYLFSNNIIKEDIDYSYLQGESMGRPSIITGTIVKDTSGHRVLVGGTSKILLKGEFYI